jgi:hypothetical protein
MLKHLSNGYVPIAVERRLYDEVLGPLEDHIIERCDEIARGCEEKLVRKDECAAQNRAVCAIATESFDNTVITELDQLARAGAERPRLIRTSERAATSLMRLAQSWTWADDFVKCEAILLRAKSIAAGTPVEVRIDEQLIKAAPPAAQQRLLQNAFDSTVQIDSSHGASHTAWNITVPNSGIRVPPFCTCCLAPTPRTRRVEHKRHLGGNRYRTIWFSLPLCEECARHEREFQVKRLLLTVGPASITAASMWGIWAGWPTLWIGWFFGIGAAIAGIAFALFGRIPVRQLSEDHSCRSQSATLISARDANCIFRFLSQRYAGAFAVANGVTASPAKAPHFGPTGGMFIACGRLTAAASFVLALATVPMCYYWQPFADNTPAVIPAANGNASASPNSDSNAGSPIQSTPQDARLAPLHQEIVLGRTRASNMETELSEIQSEVDGLKQKMSVLKATIEQDENDTTPAIIHLTSTIA